MTVFAVMGSLGPLLWETGISSDVMKPIAAPIVGGMLTSTLAVMILVPILFCALKDHALLTHPDNHERSHKPRRP